MICSNKNKARLQAFIAILALFCLTTRDANAYGPDGHHLVGAIADERLANTPTGKKVAVILDGMSLREASVIPDTIKGWDRKGVEDPKNASYFSSRPRIAAQLRDFWSANQPTKDHNSPMPSHHWFHYTDVPVEAVNYDAGKVGRSKWDIVQMISYCTAVLTGEIPEENPRKITKAVAIILLAHYVGDIHQPLHVGAQFFDQAGQPLNPDTSKQPAFEDYGGNKITLDIPGGNPEKRKNLHSFWDGDPVQALFPGGANILGEPKWKMTDGEKGLVTAFAKEEPKKWRMPPSLPLKDYAKAWANEILPVAREAHERLIFQQVSAKTEDDGARMATGTARERPMPDKLSYRAWATEVVRKEIPKGGWRLADLLDKALSSQAAPSGAASAATPSVPAETPAAPVESAPPEPSATPPPAATPDTGPYGAYPANYRDIVIGWLRVNLPDAASTIVHWQTEPKPSEMQAAPGKTLAGYLVVFNTSKTVNGVKDPAAPKQSRSVLIRDGQVIKADGF